MAEKQSLEVKVIAIENQWILIEYELEGLIDRVKLPRQLLNVSTTGTTHNIPMKHLDYGLKYSDVDLVSVLGTSIVVEISVLQDTLRRNDLWTSDDFLREGSMDVVSNVFRKLIGVDINHIITASQRHKAQLEASK